MKKLLLFTVCALAFVGAKAQQPAIRLSHSMPYRVEAFIGANTTPSPYACGATATTNRYLVNTFPGSSLINISSVTSWMVPPSGTAQSSDEVHFEVWVGPNLYQSVISLCGITASYTTTLTFPGLPSYVWNLDVNVLPGEYSLKLYP